jgi:prophage DNA circulation protein
MTVFEKYPVASWKVGNYPALRFPVSEISEEGGNRIVPRVRVYRDGAKLDDTGSEAKIWNVRVCFENSIEEEGLDAATPLYPDVLNQMIASFDIHETGELILPTRGFITARAVKYSRLETSDERDGAVVSFTWQEDNEDEVGNLQFEQYNANASAKRLGEQTVFSATSEGVWDTSLADLNELASDLEAYANYPENVVANVDSQAVVVIGAVDRIVRALTDQTDDGDNRLGDPELSNTQRKLEELRDMAGRSRSEAFRGRTRLVPFFVRSQTNIFNIATKVNQAAEELILINPSIDPLRIAAGTTIKILERQ